MRDCKTEGTDDKENLATHFVKKEKGNYDSDKLCYIQGTSEGKLKLVVKALLFEQCRSVVNKLACNRSAVCLFKKNVTYSIDAYKLLEEHE